MQKNKSKKKDYLIRLILAILFFVALYVFKNTVAVQLIAIAVFGSYLIYDELKNKTSSNPALNIIILFLILEAITISILM